MFRLFVLVLSLLQFFSVACAENGNILSLATTTSVENSGLLKHLLPLFVSEYPYDIKLTVVGSGKALKMGRSGEIDIAWVHSPASEKKFVLDGFGVKRHTVMRNDFIIAGPVHDPANITGSTDVFQALKTIAAKPAPFVSRADDSGTNKKELSIWKTTGIDPVGEDWYLESGTGMGNTLKMAENHNAYLLIDRATFAVLHQKNLKILLEDPQNLSNPYSVIAVNPGISGDINSKAASNLIDWLRSEKGKRAISSFQYNGLQLYHPVN